MVCQNRTSEVAKTAKFCMETAFFVTFGMRRVSYKYLFSNQAAFFSTKNVKASSFHVCQEPQVTDCSGKPVLLWKEPGLPEYDEIQDQILKSKSL